jgi:hypothetical protein
LEGHAASFSASNPAAKLIYRSAETYQTDSTKRAEILSILGGLLDDIERDGESFLKSFREAFVPELQASKLLCLSKAYSDILMWSHYANNHSGALMVFKSIAHDSQFKIARLVDYCSELPVMADNSMLFNLLLGLRSFGDPDMVKDAVDRVTMTKSSHWKYEKEWRMVGGNGFSPDEQTEVNPYSTSDLSALVFGPRYDRRVAQALIAEMRKHYCETSFYFAELDPNIYGLQLQALETS